MKFDQETDKIRDEIHMTATVLDKKIVHLKENSSRNRGSIRASQEMPQGEDRKSSLFRVSVAKINDSKENGVPFSKEKMELLN